MRNAVLIAAATTLAAALALARAGEPSASTSALAAKPPARAKVLYLVAPTRRCLAARGIEMTRIRTRTRRLKELADLAQRTSFEVRLRGRIVALAFGNSVLLAELMRVPGNRYRLERRANVLLMYLPNARAQATTVRACLGRR